MLKGIVAAIVAVALAIAGLLVLERAPRLADDAPRGERADVPAEAGSNAVRLFHVAADGTALVSHVVEAPSESDPLARARLVAELQLAPPDPPLISPFPAGTRLRAIYLTPEGDAFVDLSQHVSAGHPGGSLDELFTVYALVNALALNVPEITAVQILIEGREVDTLAGHVDLRRPLGLAMRWVGGAGPPGGRQEEQAGE